MRTIHKILVLVLALAAIPVAAHAIPNVWGVWNWEFDEPVHIVVTPSAAGTPLSSANHPDGTTVDATIRVQLWVQGDVIGEPNEPMPVPNFPAEDIWLEMPGLNWCLGGPNADGNTDADGWFTFSQPLGMGGWSDPPAGSPYVFVMVNGSALFEENGPAITPAIMANSPDINGDLVVNLQDVSLFTIDYFAGYFFRSDFFWDGVLNLSDVAGLAVAVGDECP